MKIIKHLISYPPIIIMVISEVILVSCQLIDVFFDFGLPAIITINIFGFPILIVNLIAGFSFFEKWWFLIHFIQLLLLVIIWEIVKNNKKYVKLSTLILYILVNYLSYQAWINLMMK